MDPEFKDCSLTEHPLADIVDEIKTLFDSISQEQDANSDADAATSNSRLSSNVAPDACSRFYQQVKKESTASDVEELLAAAWAEDPHIALRVIFHLRDTRHAPGLREQFLVCLVWLRRHHCGTLFYNLQHVHKVGYWKDLLELVIADMVGLDKYLNEYHDKKQRSSKFKYLKKSQREGKGDEKKSFGQLRREVFTGLQKMDKEKMMETAKTAFDENPEYRTLHVYVAWLFATRLRSDMTEMQADRPVSIVGKWAPSCDKRHDRLTLIASTIAQMVFPRESSAAEDREYERYVMKARNLYRSVCLAPLRAQFNVPEQCMSENRWDDIKYEKVAYACMKRNRHLFERHSQIAYKKYVEESEDRKNADGESALKPYASVERIRKLIEEQRDNSEETNHEVLLQSQWNALVEKLKEADCFLTNSLAVCGVVSNARGRSLPSPAIVMSLLIAELTTVPFSGLICEFSNSPAFFSVPDGTLNDRVAAVQSMTREYSVNIENVFSLILRQAVETNAPKENMIRRIFVFPKSRFLEFPLNKAAHEAAKRQFNDAGYELPEVILWGFSLTNRYGQSRSPIEREDGGIRASGYSKELFSIFSEGRIECLDHYSTMLNELQPYDYLRVID